MSEFISYGKQYVDEEDINAVIEALRSDYLTQGSRVIEFEKKICKIVGADYCVAVANGTAGLHLAVAVLDLLNGENGITSTNTFVASANSMVYSGVFPTFADIDPGTHNVNPESLRARITPSSSLLIPVHFAGQPCDMVGIKKLAEEYGLYIIEDAAHAIGSKYTDGTPVGNCKYSDMTVFSFHPVKTITTGEGGAVTTNNPNLYEKLLRFRSHGITKDVTQLPYMPGPWYYEMQNLGFNYRLSDIHAALGISQLNKLQAFKNRRREIANRYNKVFASIPNIKTPTELEELDTCFHLYVVEINFEKIGMSRKKFMNILEKNGIGTQVHYIPVHTQPFYRSNYGTKYGDCPIAENYYKRALSLPLYPKMTDQDVERVISIVANMMG